MLRVTCLSANIGFYIKVITLRPLLLIASFVSLFGCATNLHSSSEDYPTAVYQEGELNGETLYDILAAELAGNQNDFSYSLKKYLKQAELTKDPGIAKRAVRIAQHLRDTNSLIKASKLWINAAPEETEPHHILASIYIAKGNFSTAQPYFKTALNLGQDKVLLLLTSQLHKMTAKEVRAYIHLFNQLDNQNGNNTEHLITLGILQNRIKEHGAALKNFDQALSLDADQPSALYQKADTLKSLKKYSLALSTLNKLLSNKADDRQYNALEIQLLFLLKKDQSALAKINRQLKKNPKDIPLHSFLALTALDYEHSAQSKTIFQNLLIKNPDNSAPYFYLGIIAERNSLNSLAIQNYLQVKHGNNLLQAHTRAISLHKSAEDKEKVVQITHQFIKTFEENQTTYVLMLADWLNKFSMKNDAIELLNKHITLTPDNTDYLYARATYQEATNFAVAEKDFKRILKLKPDNAVVLNAYGYTLTIHTTRYQQAYALIKRALAISPKDPATIDSMGWVLFKLKRYPEAIEYLSQAYILFDDPEVASHLIAALASNNERDKATEIYRKISKNHPDNKFVEQARKSLEKPE